MQAVGFCAWCLYSIKIVLNEVFWYYAKLSNFENNLYLFIKRASVKMFALVYLKNNIKIATPIAQLSCMGISCFS